jgi:hypothetical protein
MIYENIRTTVIFCGHTILTDGVFVTQQPSNAGISFWRIVRVTTNCLFHESYIYILSSRWHDVWHFRYSTCLSKTYGKNSAPWKQRDDKIYEHLPSPRTYFRVCVCINAHIYTYMYAYTVMVCLCLIEHHRMKAFGEWRLAASFLTARLDRSGQLRTQTRLRGMRPPYRLNDTLGGP